MSHIRMQPHRTLILDNMAARNGRSRLHLVGMIDQSRTHWNNVAMTAREGYARVPRNTEKLQDNATLWRSRTRGTRVCEDIPTQTKRDTTGIV